MSNILTPNRFIVVEGIDGSGKSSLTLRLADFLRTVTGEEVLLLRQPGSTPAGNKLREALKDSDNPVSPTVRFFMMEASRASTVDFILKERERNPNLWVVCDRFHDSGWVYQGVAGVPDSVMAQSSALYLDKLRPSFTLLLDLDPQTALERLQARNQVHPGDKDDYDDDLAGLQALRNRYLDRMNYYSADRRAIINAGQAPGEVRREANKAMWKALGKQAEVLDIVRVKDSQPYRVEDRWVVDVLAYHDGLLQNTHVFLKDKDAAEELCLTGTILGTSHE